MTHAHTGNAVVAVFLLADETLDIHAAPRQGPPAPGSMIRDRLCSSQHFCISMNIYTYIYIHILYITI